MSSPLCADGPGAAFDSPIFDAAYAVKLPVFEGPLDLLLHLIRLNEVEITDIPIALVAKQYLEYLRLMEDVNLDVAAEYLVMAATLAWIKSRMLLPPDGAEEDEEEPDPRAELAARLIEYQRYKDAASELRSRDQLGRDVFSSPGFEPEAAPAAQREIEVGLFELLDAFRKVLETARASQPHEVEIETITVRDCMIAIMDLLETSDALEFWKLFVQPDGRAPSRAMIVATFLALLELARLGAARVFQAVSERGAPEGPIRLRLVGEHDARSWTERISELM